MQVADHCSSPVEISVQQLTRKQIEEYSWYNDNFELVISANLPEAVHEDKVRQATPQHCMFHAFHVLCAHYQYATLIESG